MGSHVDSCSNLYSCSELGFGSSSASAAGSGSTLDSRSAIDSDSITNYDSTIVEHFHPSTSWSSMEIYQLCDQSWYNMYMNTTTMGNLSGNGPIHHNYNIRQVHNLVLLFDQILCALLWILHGFLLATHTTADLLTKAGDSAVIEHNAFPEHTVVATEASTFCYIFVVTRIVAVAMAV